MLISRFECKKNNIEEELLILEQEYDIKLPGQYRRFLIKYNGGWTPKTEFKCGEESSDLRAFLGLGDVPYSIIKEVVMSDWIERQLFPIAVDSFGNYIAIGIYEKSGNIYFCDHEKNYKPTQIANTFKEFIDRCKSKKIGKILTMQEREQIMIARGKTVDDGLRKIWKTEIDKFGKFKQERAVVD